MKRLILFTLSLVLVLGLACPAYGATIEESDGYLIENDLPASEGWIQPGDYSPYASDSATIVFKKTSSTTCKAQILAARGGATKITSKMYVQILNGSTYNTITNGTATKTVYNSSINHIANFSISSRKTYRVKIALSYVEDGNTYTTYYYKSLNSNGY